MVFYETIKVALKDTTLWIRIAGMNLAAAFVSSGRIGSRLRKAFGTGIVRAFQEKKKCMSLL